MNKNELKNGYFNKIAEIKINTQDYKHGIPLTILIKKLHRIGNILSNSITQNTNQLSFGFENPSLSFVKTKDVDAIENAVLVESINQGSIQRWPVKTEQRYK